jgi:hypothetical protein
VQEGLDRNAASHQIKAYPAWLFTRGAGEPELSTKYVQVWRVSCELDLYGRSKALVSGNSIGWCLSLPTLLNAFVDRLGRSHDGEQYFAV